MGGLLIHHPRRQQFAFWPTRNRQILSDGQSDRAETQRDGLGPNADSSSIGRMNWTALVKLTHEYVERTARNAGHISGAMTIATQMLKHPGSIFHDPVHRPGDRVREVNV